MCLSIATRRPDLVLGRGEHLGHVWIVTHNTIGFRCGYVRLPHGHPWHGKSHDEIAAAVHGGLTFSEGDTPWPPEGAGDGWWIGFDCGGLGDRPDPELPVEPALARIRREAAEKFEHLAGFMPPGCVRTQEYAEAECRSLCEQAANAAVAATA